MLEAHWGRDWETVTSAVGQNFRFPLKSVRSCIFIYLAMV